MTIDEARGHIGRRVAYRGAADEDEKGKITAVGRLYVFVRYDGDEHGIATDPADLTLLAGKDGSDASPA